MSSVVDAAVPPAGTTPAEGEDDRPGIYVTVSVTVFGLDRTATAYFPDKPSDTELARELYNAATAAAQMSGTGVWLELQRLFAGSDHQG